MPLEFQESWKYYWKKNVSQFTVHSCTPGALALTPSVTGWWGADLLMQVLSQRQLHPPSVLTAFKHFQYVGSPDNFHCMENKVEEMIINKRGSRKSSTQIEDRLEQYGFSRVAMIMYLITLLGQKGNLLSINLAFSWAKIPIMLKEIFFFLFW